MNQPASELGHALLGLLHQSPLSGYDLRKLFEISPIAYYSDSPGAIYPALQRLQERGLIEPVTGAKPTGRQRRLVRPTASGRRAFRAWLSQPVTVAAVEHGLDGLVLRFAFMSGNLEHDAIERFLESLIAALREHLRALARYRRESAAELTLTGRLAFESGVEGLRTSLRWAERARREVANPRSSRRKA